MEDRVSKVRASRDATLSRLLSADRESLRRPLHPIHILIEEFLRPEGQCWGLLTADTRVTPDVAKFLSQWVGLSKEFWLGLQDNFDTWATLNGLSLCEAQKEAQERWNQYNEEYLQGVDYGDG